MEVIAISSIYETDPVGPPQADFLNAVCEVKTSMEPHELYRALKQIEEEIGRKPSPRWGPRLIDLDLLLYGTRTIDDAELTVPHKEMSNRAFVLIPLAEVASDAQLPSGEKVSEIAPVETPEVRLYQRGWLKKS
jgi:2-amino-4-hydroxy-6-hydroxymethyldihydropteridine diphosphokinase